jgi:hypothetical protein
LLFISLCTEFVDALLAFRKCRFARKEKRPSSEKSRIGLVWKKVMEALGSGY